MDNPVSGTPRTLLRLEGAAALAASLIAYQALGASWLVFAALLLVPDFALLGYLAGQRFGAIAYNAVHTYLAPGALAAVVYSSGLAAWPFVLIWTSHIGMDRMLGLGLKYPSAFRLTHLGLVGGRGRRVVRA